MDPITLGLIGLGAGGLLGGFQGFGKKKAYADQGKMASTQSAWAGLAGTPYGQLTMQRPDMLSEVGGGALKGGLTGVGVSADLAKAFKPEAGSITVANIGGVQGQPAGLVGSSPSFENQKSLWEIQSNINSGLNAVPATEPSGGRGPASVGFSRKPAGSIYGVPQMRPWNQYGGTGGR